jgi:hypothetical protein
MSLAKYLRRNPYWNTIEQELPKLGYKQFHPEDCGNGTYKVVVHAFKNGTPSTVTYPFPRTAAKSFHTAFNFKSQLRNHFRATVPAMGIYPEPDHRVRQPGMYVAHINHDVPKKVLATPKTLLPEIIVPFIPEPEPEPQPAPKPVVPVSEDMIYIILVANKRDLSTIIEVTDGTAIFKAAKPVPLDKLPKQPERKPEPEPARIETLPPRPPVPVVQEEEAPTRKKRGNVQRDILEMMKLEPERIWMAQDFAECACPKTVATSLSIMQNDGRIRRVDRGRYSMPEPPKPKFLAPPVPENPNTIRDKILAKVNGRPDRVLTMPDFMDIAAEKSVMSKLSLLVSEGQIARCGKGQYTAVRMLQAAE